MEFPVKSRLWAAIHMFFMRFPIDAIWIDRERRVVDLKRNLLPFNLLKINTWKIYIPKQKAIYLLELPVGEIQNSKTCYGDRIGFEL